MHQPRIFKVLALAGLVSLSFSSVAQALTFNQSFQGSTQGQVLGASTTAGLMGYWSFDEGSGATAGDSSGNNNPGTINAGAWAGGTIGSGSVSFNGSNSFVNAGSAASLDDMSAFTYAAWINPSVIAVGGEYDILAKANNFQNTKTLSIQSGLGTQNQLRGQVAASGASAFSSSPINAINLNAWQHVAMTYDDNGDKKIHLYINGVEISSYYSQTPGSGTLTSDASAPLLIGARGNATKGSFFNGSIDEPRIYNRALSAAEIQTIYSDTGAGTPPPPPPQDSTPPIISAITSSGISASGATITWNTDENSDTQVDYGTTASYGNSSPLNSSLATSHSATLSSLSAATLYHYRVKSGDASGNAAMSADQTFTTGSSGGSAPSIASFTASPNSITSGQSSVLSWSTSGATSVSISNIGTVVGTSQTASPTVTTNYILTATNSAGSVTANTTVTVTAGTPPPTGGGVGNWTLKRNAPPRATAVASTYAPYYSVPSIADFQNLAFYNAADRSICTMFPDSYFGGGEWGNALFCYAVNDDDGTSGTGVNTGWHLMWDSLNTQLNNNSGVGGSSITGISCSAGVVTITTSNNSAQFLRSNNWMLFKSMPSGYSNGMFRVTPSGAATGPYNNLYTRFTYSDPACVNGTATSGGSTYITNPDEYPDIPMRRHAEGMAFDSNRNAIWLSTGVGDANADANVINIPHDGMSDLYKMTKTANGGANWEWSQICGFGANAVGLSLGQLPSVGAGSPCGQQFLTSNSSGPQVAGIPCLDATTGGISTGGGGGSCGYKFPYAAFDATNDVFIIFGGQWNSSYRCETLLYYPATNTWKNATPNTNSNNAGCGSTYPTARWNTAGSRLVNIGNGKLLLFGGPANGLLNDTWIFQACPQNNQAACGWTKINSSVSPAPNPNPVIDWAPNLGKVVLIDYQSPAHVWFFDPGTLQWSDQGTGGGTVLPSLTKEINCTPNTGQNCAAPSYWAIGAYDASAQKMVVFNGCSIIGNPPCSQQFTTSQIWSLDLSGGTSTPPPPSDTQAPSVPVNLVATSTSASQITITWNSSTDNVAVAGYKVFRNGSQVSTPGINSFSDTGLTGGVSYSYTVASYDAAGNVSSQSSAVVATTKTTSVDTNPPTAPGNLSASAISSSQVNLSWAASTDNVGVAGYNIYRAGSKVGSSATANYSDSGLSPSTFYSYQIEAFDAAGNVSAKSSSASATTQAIVTGSTITPITIQESLYSGSIAGITRTQDPVSLGLPLPDSLGISSESQLGLSGTSAAQFRILGRWPSGNIKWVQVDTEADVNAGGQNTSISLTRGSGDFGGSNLAIDNGSTITVNTGPAQFTIKKANFDVIDKAVVNGKTIVAPGTSQGMVVLGPGPGQTSCGTCNTVYSSANDAASTAVIEENGPVKTVIKATGYHKDSSGNAYMGFTVRLYFYAGKTGVKATTILRNAEYGTSNTVAAAAKGYQGYELRLTPNISGTLNYSFGNHSGTPTAGTLASTDNAYLYQAESSVMKQGSWCSGSGCVVPSPLSGYAIMKNGAAVLTGTSSQVPQGWADISDSSGSGIEIGQYQLGAYGNKSLEFHSGGSDVRVGIWASENNTTGVTATAPAKPYYLAWPQYSINDVYLNFHDSLPSSLSNEFLEFQHYLVGRASTVGYYNSTAALMDPLLDTAEEDNYYASVVSSASPSVSAPVNKDIGITDMFNWPLNAWRYYSWPSTGVSNQMEFRYSHALNFLRRGFTGNFIDSAQFYKMVAELAFPRSDGFDWQSKSSGEKQYLDFPTATSANSSLAMRDQIENGMEHAYWWGMPDFYFMTGDETIRDAIVDGAKDAFMDTNSSNNLIKNGRLWNSRAVGNVMSSLARLYQFLQATGDVDAPIMLTQGQTVWNLQIKPDLCASGYPGGCTITTGANTNPGGRGTNRERGVTYQWNETVTQPGCSNYPASVRDFVPFMVGIMTRGMNEFQKVQGTSWSDYALFSDVMYGINQAAFGEMYKDNGSTAWSGNGFLYKAAIDYANSCNVGAGGPANGYDFMVANPNAFWPLFYYRLQYEGGQNIAAVQRKFNQELQNVISGGSSIKDELFQYVIGDVIYAINHPSGLSLTSVPLTNVKNNGGGSYTLSWTVPASAQSYRIKWGTQQIVDWIGFDAGSNTFIGNPATTMNWFAATDAPNIPSPAAAGTTQSATVTGLPTNLVAADFMMKAYVGSGSVPPPPATPVISSFTATPFSITIGSSTTLAWSVSNATSLSISPAIGSVTGSSISVSPVTTTAYTLTATNSAGSVTSQATVTVNLGADTTAPTASVTAPAAGATLAGTVTVSATGNDPTPAGQVVSGLKSLSLLIDSSVFASSTTGTLSKSLNTTTLTNGNHTVQVTAQDNAGNTFTTTAITVTINNVATLKFPRLISLTSLEALLAIPGNQAITANVLSPANGSVLETQTNVTPIIGKYTISFLSSDPQIVNIRIKATGYLSQLLSNVDTTVSTAIVLTVPQLLAGDLNNDNIVNSLDYSSLNAHWLQNFPAADINLDGLINSFDYAVLKNNFGRAGQ